MKSSLTLALAFASMFVFFSPVAEATETVDVAALLETLQPDPQDPAAMTGAVADEGGNTVTATLADGVLTVRLQYEGKECQIVLYDAGADGTLDVDDVECPSDDVAFRDRGATLRNVDAAGGPEALFRKTVQSFVTLAAETEEGPTEEALREGVNFDENHVMLGGYDPVSVYWSEPTLGKPEHSVIGEDGEVYLFTSELRRDVFLAHREMYTPGFGSFCTYGVGHEFPHLSPVDPVNGCTVVGDRLYCMYNAEILERFLEKGPETVITLAEREWEDLLANPQTWEDVREQALADQSDDDES